MTMSRLEKQLILPLPLNAALLEESCRQLEGDFKVSVAIHDHFGRLLDDRGESLFRDRTVHRAAVCRHRREEIPVDEACVAHCKHDILEAALEEQGVFVSRCHKNFCELVAPVHARAGLVATLYAGPFHTDRPARVPEWLEADAGFRRLFAELPFFGPDRCRELGMRLRLIAGGVLHLLEEGFGAAVDETPLKRLIRKFISDYANREIRLTDLAKALHLSPAHCSRLTARLFGRSFSRLLREERLRRAVALLRDRELTLGEIAEQAGFGNVYYFNRVFSRTLGMPPGRYRLSRAEAALPDAGGSSSQSWGKK